MMIRVGRVGLGRGGEITRVERTEKGQLFKTGENINHKNKIQPPAWKKNPISQVPKSSIFNLSLNISLLFAGYWLNCYVFDISNRVRSTV